MNNSIYEEYMRSVLGYQQMNNTYEMNSANLKMPNMTAMNTIQIQELEKCYPDIYRIVYPMIQKACIQNTRAITRDLIDSMTNEIYYAIEDREILESRNKEEKIVRNTGLNDLIRILILRELLGMSGGRHFYSAPYRLPMRTPQKPQTRPGGGDFNKQSLW